MKVRHGARRMRICLGVVVTLASAAGCAPSPEGAQYTVDEFRQNDELRKILVAQCSRDPGRLGKTANCVNALKAEKLERIGSFKDLPPLNLPAPETEKDQHDSNPNPSPETGEGGARETGV